MKTHACLALLAAAIAARGELKFETTIPGSKAHNTDAIVDGNQETWFQGYRPPYNNDFISVVLGKAQKITSVRVVTGKPDGSNKIEAGVLELSKDGRTFSESVPFSNGEATWSGKIGPVAAIRLRATADSKTMLAIREIEMIDEVLPKVVVTVPGDSTLGKLSVKCNFTAVPPKLAVRLRDELDTVADWFFTYYPRIATMIDAPRDGLVRDLEVRFRDDMKPGVPGSAHGNVMNISIPFLFSMPQEVRGMYIHELTHVAQAYPDGNKPGWLVEGIAEAVRYSLSPPDDAWRLAVDAIPPATLDYKRAYRDTAPFLLAIDKQKPGVIAKLSRAMKEKKYSEALWPDLTGKTPDEWLAAIREAGK